MKPEIEAALRALGAGARDEAMAIGLGALARDPADAHAALVLGHVGALSGDARAPEWLAQARAHAPQDPDFLASLGGAFNLLRLNEDALQAYDAALALKPDHLPSLQGIGNLALQAGDWARARALFERALAGDRDFTPARVALAQLALRENRLDEAERLAAGAPASPAALLVAAEIALRRRDFPAAIEATDAAIAAGDANPQQRAHAFAARGQALEAMAQFDEAFAAFDEANAIARKTAAHLDFAAHASAPEALARMLTSLRTVDASRWPRPAPEARSAPVFLVGFPRSGTTLLGQALNAHPLIETIEENENFADATGDLLVRSSMAEWGRLTPDDLAVWRAAYWRRAEHALGRPASKPIVVDKMPMNLILLPLVQLLFPGAKVLLALRDPRDVVLSCFKQRFALNAATVNFLSLPACVQYYDLAMQAADAARRRLPLAVCEVRYESVVADFETALRGVLDFLGAPWDEAVKDYASHAQAARIRTPSAAAVTRPITTAPVGRWRNYARRLAPYRPTLDAWARRFGYESAD